MKLLVTGGAGYIGSVVTRMLLDAGPRGRRPGRPAHRPPRGASPPDATFVEAPIHDAAEVLTPDAGFDGVLHFAALIAAGESMVKPELYWENNTVGSLALLDAIRAAGVPRLVFSSTAAVYGDPTELPITGDRGQGAHQHVRRHQARRRHGAHLRGDRARAGRRVAALLQRGRRATCAGDVALGERHDPETHLIPIALQVAAGRREKLQLFGDDYPTADGTCVRDYIHVADLARAHLLALDAADRGRAPDLQPGQRQRLHQPRRSSRWSARSPATSCRSRWPRAAPATRPCWSPRPRWPATSWAGCPQKPTLHDMVGDAWAFYRTHILGAVMIRPAAHRRRRPRRRRLRRAVRRPARRPLGGARPGQPDRRAHRLQRRLRAAVRAAAAHRRRRRPRRTASTGRSGRELVRRADHLRRGRRRRAGPGHRLGRRTSPGWSGRCARPATPCRAPGWPSPPTCRSGAGLSSSAALECGRAGRAARPRRAGPARRPTARGWPSGPRTTTSACRPASWTSPRRSAAGPGTRCSSTAATSRGRAHPVRPGRRRPGHAGHRHPRARTARRRRVRRPPRGLRGRPPTLSACRRCGTSPSTTSTPRWPAATTR